MYCVKCGSEMDDKAKFCPKCGAIVEKTVDQLKKETVEKISSNVAKIRDKVSSEVKHLSEYNETNEQIDKDNDKKVSPKDNTDDSQKPLSDYEDLLLRKKEKEGRFNKAEEFIVGIVGVVLIWYYLESGHGLLLSLLSGSIVAAILCSPISWFLKKWKKNLGVYKSEEKYERFIVLKSKYEYDFAIKTVEEEYDKIFAEESKKSMYMLLFFIIILLVLNLIF